MEERYHRHHFILKAPEEREKLPEENTENFKHQDSARLGRVREETDIFWRVAKIIHRTKKYRGR